MAHYQFYLAVVPRKGVLDKFGYIPEKLEVDYEERAKHFHLKKEGLIEDEDIFIDAMTHNWWGSTNLNPYEIIHQIDKKFLRSRWYENKTSISWKTRTEEVDNDARMSINSETGKIEELIFRTDLREKNLKMLKEIIEMGKIYDWLLMDVQGNLVAPDWKEILKLIKLSNSFKFLKNPINFLNDLHNGKIQIG